MTLTQKQIRITQSLIRDAINEFTDANNPDEMSEDEIVSISSNMGELEAISDALESQFADANG